MVIGGRHGCQPNWRSVPRSSAFTQMAEIFPSVIVSSRWCDLTSDPLAGWFRTGSRTARCAGHHNEGDGDAVGIINDLQQVGAQTGEGAV